MIDKETVVPTYDLDRGEPRGRMKRVKPGEEAPKLGDCIDCNLCEAVCPTGIDIRNGQQIGCITCGLCIDACDSVMDKINKPRGLVRYAAMVEFEGKILPPLFKRPRVIVYTAIMSTAAAVMIYGLATLAPMKLNVLHERAPLFVLLSDGSIQNKFIIKVVNKTDKPMTVQLAADGIEGMQVEGTQNLLHVEPGNVGSTSLLIKVPRDQLKVENTPVTIYAQDSVRTEIKQSYESMFIAPK
jgi:cytochrome c oxidase accessory protein FixG